MIIEEKYWTTKICKTVTGKSMSKATYKDKYLANEASKIYIRIREEYDATVPSMFCSGCKHISKHK